MTVELTIPKLGMTMTEATIANWTKAQGDWVKAGEVVLVIETEKITYEVEAPQEGYLHILEPQGALLPVGAKVGMLLAKPPAAPAQPSAPAPSPGRPRAAAAPPVPPQRTGASTISPPGRIKASPLAKRIASQHGVDLGIIRGTGPGGRVVREDVLLHLEAASAIAAKQPSLQPAADKAFRAPRPISGMRRQIIQHMHRSLQETAQMTLTTEVDATELVRLRRSLLKRREKGGMEISYNAILVRMVAQALRESPHMNVSVDGDRIVQWKGIHVGVAMEQEEGLIVPVVRDADRLTILEIEGVIQDLFQRARQRKLLPDEIRGGTFTITNLGHLGIDAFTPILNRPESGILGVGRIVERPVVVREEGEPRVEFRKRMVLSLTVDHRIIDGAPGARFLQRVGELIEDPYFFVA